MKIVRNHCGLGILATGACLVLMWVCAVAEAGTAAGRVTIDGAPVEERVTLQTTDGRLVTSDRSGQVEVRLSDGEFSVVVIPYTSPSTKVNASQTMLVGFATISADRDAPTPIGLRREALGKTEIKVQDQSGRVVANLPLSISVNVAMGDGDGPTQSHNWTDTTDADGRLILNVPTTASGDYVIRASSTSLGDRFLGEATYSFAALRKGEQVFAVDRSPWSLTVNAVWDPDHSHEPFVPDVAGNRLRHVLMIAGLPVSATTMGRDGSVRFYGLKPGKHTIALADRTDELYRITRNSQTVVIDAEAELPVQHTLYLAPVNQTRIAGQLQDANSGDPIVQALISVGGVTKPTDKNGKFSLSVTSDEDPIRMRAEHPGYATETFLVPRAGEQGGTWRLHPHPTSNGVVVTRDAGAAVPFARLTFQGPDRRFKATADRHGRYSTTLPPGTYRLRIMAPRYHGENGLDGPFPADQPIPEALVYDGTVTVPPKGLTDKIIVDRPAVIRLTLDAPDDPRPNIAAGIDPETRRIKGTVHVNGDGEVVLYVPEGRVQLVVVVNDRLGFAGDIVNATADAETSVQINIDRWQRMQATNDGGIRFIDE